MNTIAQEVLQHLSGTLGTDLTVTLEIQARNADGFSEQVVRTVTENCRTLKFEEGGFEEG